MRTFLTVTFVLALGACAAESRRGTGQTSAPEVIGATRHVNDRSSGGFRRWVRPPGRR